MNQHAERIADRIQRSGSTLTAEALKMLDSWGSFPPRSERIGAPESSEAWKQVELAIDEIDWPIEVDAARLFEFYSRVHEQSRGRTRRHIDGAAKAIQDGDTELALEMLLFVESPLC